MDFWKLCIRGFGSPSLLPHMRTILDLAKINKSLLDWCWLVHLGRFQNNKLRSWSRQFRCLRGVELGGGGLSPGGGGGLWLVGYSVCSLVNFI